MLNSLNKIFNNFQIQSGRKYKKIAKYYWKYEKWNHEILSGKSYGIFEEFVTTLWYHYLD